MIHHIYSKFRQERYGEIICFRSRDNNSLICRKTPPKFNTCVQFIFFQIFCIWIGHGPNGFHNKGSKDAEENEAFSNIFKIPLISLLLVNNVEITDQGSKKGVVGDGNSTKPN